jgi:hypothetical protein
MKPNRRISIGFGALRGVLTLSALLPLVASAEPAPFMMQAMVAGKPVDGQPLEWNDQEMKLLGRDGALYQFKPADAKNAKRYGKGFVGYNSQELHAKLRDEFDRSFEITTTPHFVVVHPAGHWRAWGERLESLYRSFAHYMSVRGMRMTEPPTPLVAVVFRSQEDYYRHAAAGGTPLPPGVLGHYDPDSNRVFLFDIEAKGGNPDWSDNAETIIHEATHQTAFNLGVHSRFGEQPRWLVEGLALMFEARGVWDNASLQQQQDRINRGRLADFKASAKSRSADWLKILVASDKPFQYYPGVAYAEAWALTFYLCETRPQEYGNYLARVAARPAFSTYPPQERLADFTAAFGKDLALLSAQLQRYVDELP